jgi:hypothetical protein
MLLEMQSRTTAANLAFSVALLSEKNYVGNADWSLKASIG